MQPLIWIYAAKGLRIAINKGVVMRNWNPVSAKRVFSTFMVTISLIITTFVSLDDYIKAGVNGSRYAWQNYQTGDRFITTNTSNKTYKIMVNNPAAYNIATDRQAIVIPYGKLATIYEAVKFYDIEFLAIDKNHIIEFHDLYYSPQTSSRMEYLGSEMDIQIYRFLNNE